MLYKKAILIINERSTLRTDSRLKRIYYNPPESHEFGDRRSTRGGCKRRRLNLKLLFGHAIVDLRLYDKWLHADIKKNWAENVIRIWL